MQCSNVIRNCCRFLYLIGHCGMVFSAVESELARRWYHATSDILFLGPRRNWQNMNCLLNLCWIICYGAAGRYEDMRTGPRHIFRVNGEKNQDFTHPNCQNSLKVQILSDGNYIGILSSKKKNSFLEEIRTHWKNKKHYKKTSQRHDWNSNIK